MIRPEKHSTPQVSRSSMIVAALSTVVEWYDFTLYLYFATVLSRVFFGGGENSLLATLGGFAGAFVAVPLAAIVDLFVREVLVPWRRREIAEDTAQA